MTDMPIMVVVPAETIAMGKAPDWHLTRQGNIVVLHREDLPDLTATLLPGSDTPGGRIVRAPIIGAADAVMTLRFTPGVCHLTASRGAIGFVSVTVPDATILRGCALPR